MKIILPLLLLLILSACAEDDSLTLEPNFNSINNDLFSKSCTGTGCHAGTSPALGLNLESDQSHANLVGQASLVGGIALVLAGDPDNSYLIRKLEGADSIAGDRMPPPDVASAISQSNINAIRQWITDGAIE